MHFIRILYFEGCPNHPPVVEMARRVVAEHGWRAPTSYTTLWFRSVAMDGSWSGAEADIHEALAAGAGGR